MFRKIYMKGRMWKFGLISKLTSRKTTIMYVKTGNGFNQLKKIGANTHSQACSESIAKQTSKK